MKQELSAVLVGCGSISRTWLRSISAMEDLRLIALVDLVEDQARRRAADFGLERVEISTDLGAVLARARPDIVFDCTVPTAHHKVTLTALSHGCHVLGEKPLAESMPHAQEMVAAAKHAGRLYAVMQNRRYDPNIRRLRAFLRSGVLGRLTTVNCDFYVGAHFGGFRERMEHVLLLDMAIHTFDASRLLMGADPLSVYCHEWNPHGSWYDHDASAAAVFEMSDDIVYAYRGSWCAEGMNTTWESRWHIIGEHGSVVWDGSDSFQAQVVEEAGAFRSRWRDVEVPVPGVPTKQGGHSGCIGEFVDCVRDGGIPETACTDNIRSLAMVLGAVESAERARKVEIAV